MTRVVLAALLSLALAAGCRSSPGAAPPATVSLAELLRSAQEETGANYTYSEATARALDDVRIERPSGPVDARALEVALSRAGFLTRQVGPPHIEIILVAQATSP